MPLATCQWKRPPLHWRNQALIPPMERGVFQLAGLSDMVNAASGDLPIETPPFPLAESGPDSANGKGGFQLAGLSDMVNAASCDLPMETPPLHWRNQALIPPMERGGAALINHTRTTPRIAVPPHPGNGGTPRGTPPEMRFLPD